MVPLQTVSREKLVNEDERQRALLRIARYTGQQISYNNNNNNRLTFVAPESSESKVRGTLRQMVWSIARSISSIACIGLQGVTRYVMQRAKVDKQDYKLGNCWYHSKTEMLLLV